MKFKIIKHKHVLFLGNDYDSEQQLLECLWAYEELKNEKGIGSDAEFVARAEELRRYPADNILAPITLISSTGREPSAATAQQSGSAQESQCVMYMSAARTVVLIPCGHLVVCRSCYWRLQQCPVCRLVIRGAIRSYL